MNVWNPARCCTSAAMMMCTLMVRGRWAAYFQNHARLKPERAFYISQRQIGAPTLKSLSRTCVSRIVHSTRLISAHLQGSPLGTHQEICQRGESNGTNDDLNCSRSVQQRVSLPSLRVIWLYTLSVLRSAACSKQVLPMMDKGQRHDDLSQDSFVKLREAARFQCFTYGNFQQL